MSVVAPPITGDGLRDPDAAEAICLQQPCVVISADDPCFMAAARHVPQLLRNHGTSGDHISRNSWLKWTKGTTTQGQLP